MPTLPIEITTIVLEMGYYKEDLTEDHETLLACSLVSSSWTDPAQKLLFHSIGLAVFASQIKTKVFNDAVCPSTERGKVLGSYVRKLEINLGSETSNAHHDHGYKHQFTLLLSYCPRLYELTLQISIHELDDVTMCKLRYVANDVKIRALNLSLSGVQSPILYQLISVWPGIQFLSIGSEIAASPPLQPSNIQLHDLSLVRNLPLECLEWLLSASETSLKILDLRDIPGRSMKNIVAKHGPHIRSLRIFWYNKDSADIVRLCTRLEELTIFRLSSDIQVKDLPSTIEHFSFRDAGSSLKNFIPFVEKHPNLRLVSCWKKNQERDDFPALLNACLAKNIELIFLNLSRKFVNEDLVIPRRFPRRRSVSNFSLMN